MEKFFILKRKITLFLSGNVLANVSYQEKTKQIGRFSVIGFNILQRRSLYLANSLLNRIMQRSTTKKSFFVLGLACFLSNLAFAQPEVYPPNWWTNMKLSNLQLLLRSPDPTFSQNEVRINYPGITLNTVNTFENGKYLVLDITISSNAKAGVVPIEVGKGKKPQRVAWTLKERSTNRKYAQGVRADDFIYFLMPDRFSNGDPSNDKIKGLKDQSLNRDSIFHRHGGDLQGVINHLDYLQELGVTALWLTPVLQNDMPNRSEHGYAITNHYKVEPRFGGEAAYKKLGDELHRRGMKLIQDAVYNHVGFYHFLVQDKPAKDWLHEWPSYTGTTYKDQPMMDPYSVSSDKKRLSDGWFTPMMPDLNHSNPYVANYLIQHAIWCVEEFGVDGWRIDTYIYNDLEFMNRCNQALLDEYPNVTMFGEAWVHGILNQAFFGRNNLNTKFKSNLPGLADFQLNMYGIEQAVNEPFGWTNGVNRLYTTLASDFVYQDPTQNVIFLDNHDKSRFFSVVGEDIRKQKMGLAWLFTCRGIPQLYYGTEILMKNFSNPDGLVRLDFPGGWAGDKANKFTKEGRNEKEQEVFEWTKRLGTFRKNSTAIGKGKFIQYVPEDGIYVYFRQDDAQTVMCIMNSNDKESSLNPARFSETLGKHTRGKEVTTDKVVDLKKDVSLPAKYVMVLELAL
jgi:neopullulanase